MRYTFISQSLRDTLWWQKSKMKDTGSATIKIAAYPYKSDRIGLSFVYYLFPVFVLRAGFGF